MWLAGFVNPLDLIDFTTDFLLLTEVSLKFTDNFIIIPAKARDYVFTGVGLSVCLFVCYHDN